MVKRVVAFVLNAALTVILLFCGAFLTVMGNVRGVLSVPEEWIFSFTWFACSFLLVRFLARWAAKKYGYLFGEPGVPLGELSAGTRRYVILNNAVVPVGMIILVGVLLLFGKNLSVGKILGLALASVFCMIALTTFISRLARNKHRPAPGQAGTAIDDFTRDQILRAIRAQKIWVCFLVVGLVVGLPIGITDARSDHIYWPLAAGVAINLLLMYTARKELKRLKKRLDPDPFLKI